MKKRLFICSLIIGVAFSFLAMTYVLIFLVGKKKKIEE